MAENSKDNQKKKAQKPRPLSPHLTIYKPQITSISSILTRITGAAIIVVAVIIVVWFWVLSSGDQTMYKCLHDYIHSLIGRLVFILSLWGIWYHFLAGLRHLYWDTGKGLELNTAQRLGWLIIFGSFVLAITTLLILT